MKREMNLKTIAYAMPTATLTKLGKDLRTAGYTVDRDNSAGTFVAKLDDEIVVRALKMRGSSWLVRADPRVVTPTTA